VIVVGKSFTKKHRGGEAQMAKVQRDDPGKLFDRHGVQERPEASEAQEEASWAQASRAPHLTGPTGRPSSPPMHIGRPQLFEAGVLRDPGLFAVGLIYGNRFRKYLGGEKEAGPAASPPTRRPARGPTC
jgi:hypothetical protein